VERASSFVIVEASTPILRRSGSGMYDTAQVSIPFGSPQVGPTVACRTSGKPGLASSAQKTGELGRSRAVNARAVELAGPEGQSCEQGQFDLRKSIPEFKPMVAGGLDPGHGRHETRGRLQHRFPGA
jgi:hypothetical protein